MLSSLRGSSRHRSRAEEKTGARRPPYLYPHSPGLMQAVPRDHHGFARRSTADTALAISQQESGGGQPSAQDSGLGTARLTLALSEWRVIHSDLPRFGLVAPNYRQLKDSATAADFAVYFQELTGRETTEQ